MGCTEQKRRLPRSTPESEGVSSKGLVRLLDAMDGSGLEFHHFSMARHGKIILQADWAPYKPCHPHMTHSLTKLFTNTAVGMACDEGFLSLDDKVVSFFPDELPETVGENLEAMSVRDLITMRCGHEFLLSGNKWRPIKTSWVAEFFKEPLPFKPGERFVYTSATSYMLSAIVQKVTGMTAHEYMQKRLFSPLGIEGETWDLCPHGINSGGNGLTIKNEDALKVGLVYLNGGTLDGKRYLSPEWVKESMYDSCKLNPDTGYGFHQSNENGFISSGGIFGQTVVILPAHDAVLSINAAYQENRPNALDNKMREIFERDLLPILNDAPLKRDPEAEKSLAERAGRCSLPTPDGQSHSSNEKRYSGTYAVTAPIDGITSFSLEFDDKGCLFSMTDDRGTHSIRCGAEDWVYGASSMSE